MSARGGAAPQAQPGRLRWLSAPGAAGVAGGRQGSSSSGAFQSIIEPAQAGAAAREWPPRLAGPRADIPASGGHRALSKDPEVRWGLAKAQAGRRSTKMAPIGQFVRILAQAAMPVIRAFATAYQQALHNARRGGTEAANEILKSKKGGFTMMEATQILDIEGKELSKELVNTSYKRIFEANEPNKGGSFYIQSKVYRAREFLIGELTKGQKEQQKEGEAKK